MTGSRAECEYILDIATITSIKAHLISHLPLTPVTQVLNLCGHMEEDWVQLTRCLPSAHLDFHTDLANEFSIPVVSLPEGNVDPGR